MTGTPLLGTNYNSRSLFGEYIHKYYYNSSIADGYTLRLIREEIETSYKLTLQEALKEIKNKQEQGIHRLVVPLDGLLPEMETNILRFGEEIIKEAQ